MKKLLVGCAVAVAVLSASVAWANCGSCEKKEGAACVKPAKKCPCLCVEGLNLTAEQKAKVDEMQAKCKDGCKPECCKQCMTELKQILTPEQLKAFKQNCKACKKQGAGCPKGGGACKKGPAPEAAK